MLETDFITYETEEEIDGLVTKLVDKAKGAGMPLHVFIRGLRMVALMHARVDALDALDWACEKLVADGKLRRMQ